MRVTCQPQLGLDCIPIPFVPLNSGCRDEIIPILRALQHVYENPDLRAKILKLVGKDVNKDTSRNRGRTGMDYWQITVLAAVRLGCNLNYDKLQDLAEQHRSLRQIMGIGDWLDHVRFDWRRIRANIARLSPETIRAINDLIVAAGHQLAPDAPRQVRGDCFVAETNIHYPTDSSLITDGLRKIITLAAALALLVAANGWRQSDYLLKTVRRRQRAINQAARSKAGNKEGRVKKAYRPLFHQARKLLERARELLARTVKRDDAEVMELRRQLEHFCKLTEKVCEYSTRRVIHGETIANDEKIFSMFEPHTELIRRGKAAQENQFGHNVLIVEDAAGFICDYQVLPKGAQDRDVVVPTMRTLQERLQGRIRTASFDRGFHSPENQVELEKIVRTPCVPIPGQEGVEQAAKGKVRFRRARQRHPGVESAVHGLQSGNGLKRCRDRTEPGYERYVGLGVLGRNLHVLGKLLLAREASKSPAAHSKRKSSCA